MTLGASALEAAYTALQARIRAASGGRAVTLIAVSKTVDVERIDALYRLGHRDFGENYVQELLAKAAAFEARGVRDLRWHFIGHLQTNKVKQLLPVAHAVHTVDSEKLARELSKRWREGGHIGRLPVFIEVNIDSEPAKAGVPPAEAVALAGQVAALDELDLRGLMCVPRARGPGERTQLRERFAALGALERQCGVCGGQLSMGMSADFELALAEGATHVRVGTALFGARQVTASI